MPNYQLPENLRELFKEESRLRSLHIDVIGKSLLLQRHVKMMHDSMDVITACIRQCETKNQDSLTVQMLGLRLQSSIAASFTLTTSGYFQAAGQLVRDVTETSFLLDYFRIHPEEIAQWRAADQEARRAKYAPRKIRSVLNKNDGIVHGERDRIYKLLSTYATHPTHEGFSLNLTEDRLGRSSPCYDDKLFRAMIEEIVRCAPQAARSFIWHFRNFSAFTAYAAHFFNEVKQWEVQNKIDYPGFNFPG